MKRFAAIVVFAGAVLISTHILAPAAPPPPIPQAAAADLLAIAQAAPVIDQVDAQVDRLRERLANPPQYPPPTRNPFQFGSRTEPPRPKTKPSAETAGAVVVDRGPALPALPHLVAIATNVVDGALVRTAVLATGDDVQVVKIGDTCGTLTVRTIGIDAVELVEPATSRTFKLALQ